MKPNPFLIPRQWTSPAVADRTADRLREAKRLRDETGTGITACVKALEEAGGFDRAIEILRISRASGGSALAYPLASPR
jgi:hypothetical protein